MPFDAPLLVSVGVENTEPSQFFSREADVPRARQMSLWALPIAAKTLQMQRRLSQLLSLLLLRLL